MDVKAIEVIAPSKEGSSVDKHRSVVIVTKISRF